MLLSLIFIWTSTRYVLAVSLSVLPAPQDGKVAQCSQLTLIWDQPPPIHLHVQPDRSITITNLRDLGVQNETFMIWTVDLPISDQQFSFAYNTLADPFTVFQSDGVLLVKEGNSTACLKGADATSQIASSVPTSGLPSTASSFPSFTSQMVVTISAPVAQNTSEVQKSNRTPTGAIVGGVIGGIFVGLILGAALVVFLYRRRGPRTPKSIEDGASANRSVPRRRGQLHIEPFTPTAPNMSQIISGGSSTNSNHTSRPSFSPVPRSYPDSKRRQQISPNSSGGPSSAQSSSSSNPSNQPQSSSADEPPPMYDQLSVHP